MSIQRSLYIDLSHCLTLICSIQHQIKLIDGRKTAAGSGHNPEEQKALPGMWLAENEAKFWLHVLSELKNRGLNDRLY